MSIKDDIATIFSDMEEMRKLTKENTKVSVASSATSRVNSPSIFGNTLLAILISLGYFWILFFYIFNERSSLYIGGFIDFIIIFLNEYMFRADIFVWALVLFLFIFILMVIFKASDKKIKGFMNVFYFILFVGVILLGVGYFDTSTLEGQENIEEFGSEAGSVTSGYFDKIKQIFCDAGLRDDCVEEVEGKVVETTDDFPYLLRFEEDKNPLIVEMNNLDSESIIANYDVVARGDLVIKEFKCYINSKKEENLFYSKPLDVTIKEDSYEPIFYSCLNFTDKLIKRELLEYKDRQEVKIIPVLVVDLYSTITQEVPVIDYNMYKEEFGAREMKNKWLEFSDKHQEIKDVSGKIRVESTFYDKLPIILGDDNKQKRPHSLIFEKLSSVSFGRFSQGEITKVEFPSSLISDKEENFYFGKYDLKDGKKRVDFFVTDNEDFEMNQKEIIQYINIDYTSTFEKIGLIKLDVIMDESFKPKTEEEKKEEDALEAINEPNLNNDVSEVSEDVIDTENFQPDEELDELNN